MAKKSSRRQFLRWIGASSGALLLSNLGCSGTSTNSANGSNAGGDTGSNPGADAGDVGEAICKPTGSDILGPFHEPGAPNRTQLAAEDEPGERLVIEGTVYGPDCTTPLAGALLDVWQADEDGNYHGTDDDDFRLRGQMTTEEDGTYRFETIVPGNYLNAGSLRPAHIHYTITKPGHSPLTTQLYFEGDPHLAPDDPCTTCSSGDDTLIIELRDNPDDDGQIGTFDIVLE